MGLAMKFAGKLRRVRKEGLGINQRELARRLKKRDVPHSSYASVRRYETGERTPGTDYLAAVADMVGWEVQAFFVDWPDRAFKDISEAFRTVSAEIALQEHLEASTAGFLLVEVFVGLANTYDVDVSPTTFNDLVGGLVRGGHLKKEGAQIWHAFFQGIKTKPELKVTPSAPPVPSEPPEVG